MRLENQENRFAAKLHVWRDVVDATQPGDTWESVKPGQLHAAAEVWIPIPLWLARFWNKRRQYGRAEHSDSRRR